MLICSRTWFIWIAHTEHGEDENEAEEEFNAKALQRQEFGGERGVTQPTLIRLGQQCFQRGRSGCGATALGNDVEDGAHKAHFASDQKGNGNSGIDVAAAHMTDSLKTELMNVIINDLSLCWTMDRLHRCRRPAMINANRKSQLAAQPYLCFVFCSAHARASQ